MTVKVQIYLRSADDAAMSARAGADFIGIVADDKGLLSPSKVYDETQLSFVEAKEVFAALPERTMKVALTVETQVQDILRIEEAILPDVIHLAGPHLPPTSIQELRSSAPTIKVMQAIAMNGPDPIEMAIRYQPVCDYFLLDTNDPDKLDLGATGKTHDWSISAELVNRVNIPVILAGGLSPENVEEAISTVRPWGVDSFTHTNYTGRNDRKDPVKVRDFITNAKRSL